VERRKPCNAFRWRIKITAESRCKSYTSIKELKKEEAFFSNHQIILERKRVMWNGFVLRLFANNCFLIVLPLSSKSREKKLWLSETIFPSNVFTISERKLNVCGANFTAGENIVENTGNCWKNLV
jgi:hypothetical protein